MNGDVSGFYRHCAPLERRRWTYRDSIDISLRWSERTHVAPLGLGVVGIGYCYKHVAPLGLVVMRKEKGNADRSLRHLWVGIGQDA